MTRPRQVKLDREEIRASQDRYVRLIELFLGGLVPSLRRRCDAMTPQDIAHDLMRDVIAKIGQCADDPIVSLAGILPRHTNDQVFDGGIDLRTAKVEAAFGTVELASDQAPVPSQNDVGFGGTGRLGEMPTPQPLADFRQS